MKNIKKVDINNRKINGYSLIDVMVASILALLLFGTALLLLATAIDIARRAHEARTSEAALMTDLAEQSGREGNARIEIRNIGFMRNTILEWHSPGIKRTDD